MRCDLEQVEAAARAVIRTSAIAPRDDTQLRRAEGGKILRTVDDVSRERCDFFLHRREASGAGRIGPLVDLGLPLERSTIRLRWCRLLRSRHHAEAHRDESDTRCPVEEITVVMCRPGGTLHH